MKKQYHNEMTQIHVPMELLRKTEKDIEIEKKRIEELRKQGRGKKEHTR